MNIDVASARRVAVFRALQLGDLLCAIPALRALRAGIPSAEVTLIGLPWARALVERFPDYVDQFLEFPGWPGLPEQACRARDVPTFLEAAQRRRFDLAIQLHGDGRITNPLIALFGARRIAGFCGQDAYVPDPDLFIDYPDDEPEIGRMLRLMQHLGFPPRGDALEFPIREADRAALASLHSRHDISPGDYICLHPGARDSSRRWPAASFATVGDHLAARGLQIILTGAADDACTLASVEAAMVRPCINLAAQTDLGTLAAVVEGARLVVCNDTGISHMAAALRTPSVILFLTSDPLRWAPLDGTVHRPIRARASSDVVAEVLAEAERLLSGTQ